ncbi:hypothetical protein [Deinococcus yavapaiensis]|nr:hypothetical protein [Deinococcus yavapaiensis]
MTMQDRVLTALRQAGFDGRPAATLDKDGAVFALLDDTLLYLEDSGARSVSLRDINRIHSDAAGVLRVETPAGTAITASLVGFDPTRVQHFFKEVKDATNRAKSLPPAPTPAGSNPAWKTGWAGGATQPSAVGGSPVTAAQASVVTPSSTPETVTPTPTAVEEPRRVVISSAPKQAAEPVVSAPQAPREAESTPEAFTAPRSALPRIPDVGRFAPTLRLLGVLMFLVGAGVGFLQWRAGAQLTGLWTFGIGGVGAFALYVFGEVVRAVAGIAARVSREG